MNHPAHPPASTANPSGGRGGRTPSTPRARLFTPLDIPAPTTRSFPLRLAPRTRTPNDDGTDWVDGLETSAVTPPPRQQFGSRSASPFVPNLAVPFLRQLRTRFHPRTTERRLIRSMQVAAGAGLAGIVVLVVGASIRFHPRPAPSRPPAHDAHAAASPIPPVDAAVAVDEAAAVLTAFLQADTAAARRHALDTDGFLPAALERDGRVACLHQARFDGEGAQFLHARGRAVVLFPFVDGIGLPRTAAVVQRHGRWGVDWRSVLTPEPGPWEEFRFDHGSGPQLFRVLIRSSPDGEWSVARPSSDSHSSTAPATPLTPTPRIAAEWSATMAEQQSSTLAVDAYLSAGPDRQLHIVEWTKDKWSL